MILVGFGMVIISFPAKRSELISNHPKMKFTINSFLPGITFILYLLQSYIYI